MIKYSTLLLFIFYGVFNLCAQPGDAFKSSGIIPDDIYLSTVEKSKAKISEISATNKNESRAVRLSQVQFYKSSYYVIDAAKNNAGIYVNDELTLYVNQLADFILKDDPELRAKLRFFAYRSPYANAFSTDQGDIFINVGLMAYLNNEAELAFVLCHEIIHFIKSHNITGVTERKKAEIGVGKYRDIQLDKSIEAVHNFSKDLEKEADIEGLKFFLKTGYDYQSVASLFDVLKQSNLPFQNIAFNANKVASPFFTIPIDYLKAEKIRAKNDDDEDEAEDEDKDEKFSTHPNIEDRIAYSNEFIGKHKSGENSGIKFKIKSEKAFLDLKQKAQASQCFYYFEKSLYAKAFYTAYLLYNQTQDEQYRRVMVNCLFCVNQLRTYDYAMQDKSFDLGEGHQYPVYHLFYKLKKNAFSAVNFAFCYGLFQQNPTDSFYLNSTKSALLLLAEELGNSWKTYQKKQWDTANITSSTMRPILPFLKLAFEDPLFAKHFGKTSDYNKKDDESHKLVTYTANEPKTLDKVLIVNPFYIRYDETKKGNIDFDVSYLNEAFLLDQLKYVAHYTDKKATILDVRNADKKDASIFDEIALTTGYLNKFSELGLNEDREVRPYSEAPLHELMHKYDCDYLMFVGVRTYKGELSFKGSYLFLNILSPTLLPYSLQKALQRERMFGTYYLIIDPKTNKVVKKGENIMSRVTDNNKTIALSLYEIFKTL